MRDTAQQLLVARFTAADIEPAKTELKKIAVKNPSPQTRLQAYYAHEYLDLPRFSLLEKMLEDEHPAIRKHAVDLAAWYPVERYGAVFAGFVDDGDPRIRLQLAYALGRLPSGYKLLAHTLLTKDQDPYVFAAGMSSLSPQNYRWVMQEAATQKDRPEKVLVALTKLAKQLDDPSAPVRPQDLTKIIESQLRLLNTGSKVEQITNLAEFLVKLDALEISVSAYLVKEENTNLKYHVKDVHQNARLIVQDAKAPATDVQAAVRVLGRGLGDDRDDHKLLLSRLTPQTSDQVQAAVVRQFAMIVDPRVPGLLAGAWKSYSPALRNQVLDVLLTRPMWTNMTLDMIQKKTIPAHEIDAVHRQRFLQHKDAAIRDAAKEIFAAASSTDRGKVADLYWASLPANGNPKNGAKLFAKACATCHKLGDVGQNVGPDFAAIGDKSPQGLLTAILDPNRAVEARYINYVAETKNGRVLSGILTNETSTQITLTTADGKQHQLLRNELDSLESTGKSLMPEGLEKDLTPQEMADLIAHIRGALPSPKRKTFPGNEPKTITPAKDGRLHLLPSSAAIYGSSLVIEKKYGNLGYWSKPDDHVIWTVELAKETTFSVWLDYAVAPEAAGNVLVVTCGSETRTHTIKSTGSWDAYQLQSIGPLRIPAGRHEIVIRAEGPIRGALLDLKEVELRPR